MFWVVWALFLNQPQDAEKLGVRLLGIFESGQSELVDELFHPEGVYVDHPNHTKYVGHARIKGYVEHIHRWASQVEIEVNAVHAMGDHAAVEWTMTAIQSGPIGDLVPLATNRQVKIEGVTLVKAEAGQIVWASDYMDVMGFVMQLGGKVELPGGRVLQAD